MIPFPFTLHYFNMFRIVDALKEVVGLDYSHYKGGAYDCSGPDQSDKAIVAIVLRTKITFRHDLLSMTRIKNPPVLEIWKQINKFRPFKYFVFF